MRYAPPTITAMPLYYPETIIIVLTHGTPYLPSSPSTPADLTTRASTAASSRRHKCWVDPTGKTRLLTATLVTRQCDDAVEIPHQPQHFYASISGNFPHSTSDAGYCLLTPPSSLTLVVQITLLHTSANQPTCKVLASPVFRIPHPSPSRWSLTSKAQA